MSQRNPHAMPPALEIASGTALDSHGYFQGYHRPEGMTDQDYRSRLISLIGARQSVATLSLNGGGDNIWIGVYEPSPTTSERLAKIPLVPGHFYAVEQGEGLHEDMVDVYGAHYTKGQALVRGVPESEMTFWVAAGEKAQADDGTTEDSSGDRLVTLEEFMAELDHEMTADDLEAFGEYLGARPRNPNESEYQYRTLIEHASVARQRQAIHGGIFVDALVTLENAFDVTASFAKGQVYNAERETIENTFRVFTGTQTLNPNHYMRIHSSDLAYSEFIVSDPRPDALKRILSDANSDDSKPSLDDLIGQYNALKGVAEHKMQLRAAAIDDARQAGEALRRCGEEIRAMLKARGLAVEITQ